MKKIFKWFAVVLSALILLTAIFAGAWVFFIFPNFIAPQNEASEDEPGFAEIAEELEKVDYNESNGVLYVNNEIVVFASQSATEEEISAFLDSLDAEVDESMADIGSYRLIFKTSMTYDELESLLKRIKSDPAVEDAYLNTVSEFEADTTEEEDDFSYKEPVYPDDPWNEDSWNVRAPRGENWGMEAIDAPGAWGYLDQLSTVKIGLIDSMPNLSHEDLSFANSSCLFINEDTGVTEINKYALSADDHGTHVAGTMNARWNDAGVSGVMGGKGELYYSAVYYYSGKTLIPKYATAYSYLLALKTLIDQDVQVINISQNTRRLVGFAASHGNQNAIDYLSMQADLTEKGLSRIIVARTAANKPDFVICVAAGNSNQTYYFKDDKAPYGYREEMTGWEKFKWIFGWRGEIGNSQALYNNFLSLMDTQEVKDRVIVVGAVNIDDEASTPDDTRYEYAYYSNVGSRVDIVAPGGIPDGTQVYSCLTDGYGGMSGTSMATPHVSGVAGLIFASNPSLSGPEVKNILIASGTGRYYHGGSYSALLNANNSVVNGLKTVETSVGKVLKTEADDGLDLCFVVDTTGSMEDDIANARENMADILEHLSEKTENYRVGLIDYRDYPERSDESRDYPYRVQLHFTNNNQDITDAINALDLGHGGDDEETVYSALMAAVDLDWRSDAKKVIIILGDAAPLDPEPVTDLTYDDVLLALFNADINIDDENSDDRVLDALDTSLINVFSIGTDASSDAEDFFRQISDGTGGSYASVDDASEVSDAIVDSIEQIEIVEKVTVTADFGDAMANEKIDLYSENEYLFTAEADENGVLVIDSIAANTYEWTSNSLYGGGMMDISADSRAATIWTTKDYWFTPLLAWWHQHTAAVYAVFLVYLAVCILIPVLVKRICARTPKKKKIVPQNRECFCHNCGNRCQENEIFCGRCGARLIKK